MKKVLLMAAVALITVTANAQKANKGFTKRNQNKNVVVASGQHTKVNEANANFTLLNKDNMKKQGNATVNPFTLKAANKVSKTSSRHKVGALQASYNGSGKDYFTGEKLEWTMKSGTIQLEGQEIPALIDVIPLPSDWASLGQIPVTYTIDGSTITIPAQHVVTGEDESGAPLYYYLHSWESADGAIVFTLGDDGSLTTISGEDIAYSSFTENRFDLTTAAGIYDGSLEDVINLQYRVPGQTITPVADYAPSSFILRAGCNTSWSYWYLLMSSATAPMEFANASDIYDQSAWTINIADWNGSAWEKGAEAGTGSEDNFSFTPELGEVYYVPELVASYEGNPSEPAYYLDESARIFAGGDAADFNFGTGTSLPTWGNFASENGLTTAGTAGADAIIAYQGKPGSPFYFEGINVLMYNFVQGDNFNMTCKVVKATREESGRITIGETIAEADVDLDDIEVGTYSTRLNFNDFYAYDEDGMSYSLDYLMIEDEFAVIFEGVNTSADAGFTGSFLCYTDAGYYTYAILPGQTTWTGSGWSGRKVIVGFNEAVFGYLATEDDTNITFPEEGGDVTLHINPMFSRTVNDKPTTWLDVAEDSELPDWISYETTNEVYTDTEYSFDLVITADPLTSASGAPRKAESAGRTAEFSLVQPGAKLTFTVTQGAVTGISDVKVTKTTTDGKVYNIAGQRLNNNAKGLVVKDGKKFIVK